MNLGNDPADQVVRFTLAGTEVVLRLSGIAAKNLSLIHICHIVLADRKPYKVELNSPTLEYSEMDKLQEVVRTLRRAGAFVNSSGGLHIHVDASNHTPQSLKNALSIMYSKEDILFKALNVSARRSDHWCQKVREQMLDKIRSLPTNITMDRLSQEWYEGSNGSHEHYNKTRYYALNLHSVFYRGTLEWRCFESTLHAGKVRAYITLALAISAQAKMCIRDSRERAP